MCGGVIIHVFVHFLLHSYTYLVISLCLTCPNCLDYADEINERRGDHHEFSPTNSDYGGLF